MTSRDSIPHNKLVPQNQRINYPQNDVTLHTRGIKLGSKLKSSVAATAFLKRDTQAMQ